MKIVMLWHGGMGYAHPDEDDGEEFSSLEEAKFEFARRVWNAYYPGVEPIPPEEGGPEAQVYPGTLEDWCPANGPDRTIKFGPRGGVVVTR